jgi:hypothetical protein
VSAPPSAAARARVSAPQVLATGSRLLFDTLAEVYAGLGFATVADDTFRDLAIARIVEPTSIMDSGRVLTDLGVSPASERTTHAGPLRGARLARPGREGLLHPRCHGRGRVVVSRRPHHALLRGREGG